MKKILFSLPLIILFSCSLKKEIVKGHIKKTVVETSLIEEENNILDIFLENELKAEKYKHYEDFEIVVIEEALSKKRAIHTYLYSLDEWNTMNKINKSEDIRNIYFLDTIQIKKIKTELENEEQYHWRASDFKNIKTSLLKHEELREVIRTSAYIALPPKLIIYLSKPLIIDGNNAFISFEIGNGQLGFSSINRLTVLMRKINNKWIEEGFYFDGVFY